MGTAAAFAQSEFAITALWDGGAAGNSHYKEEGTASCLQDCCNHHQIMVT